MAAKPPRASWQSCRNAASEHMKSIIIAAPNYHPETGAAAKRITAMAEYLAQHGWRVTVVTLLPHYPQNKIYAGYEGPAPRKSEENGVTVIRYRPWIVPKANLALRLLSETVFCLQAMLYILRHKTDVVLASSPHMFLGPLGLLGSRLRGTKFVWDVRDLTWLYPRATGKRTFGLDRLLDLWMRAVASRCDAFTAATEGLHHYFSKHPSLAVTLPNGISDHLFKRLAMLEPSQGPPLVAYVGLFGYNHNLTTVIDAASRLPHINVVLVGDGPERDHLQKRAASYGLNNIAFVGYLSGEKLEDLYRRATLLISHVRQHPIYQWTQPAKLWEYMATGRPVIHAGEGEAVKIINEHDIGITVPPDNPQALARAINDLVKDPARAAALGERGRKFVEAHRRHSVLFKQLADLLDALVGTSKPSEDRATLSS